MNELQVKTVKFQVENMKATYLIRKKKEFLKDLNKQYNAEVYVTTVKKVSYNKFLFNITILKFSQNIMKIIKIKKPTNQKKIQRKIQKKNQTKVIKIRKIKIKKNQTKTIITIIITILTKNLKIITIIITIKITITIIIITIIINLKIIKITIKTKIINNKLK